MTTSKRTLNFDQVNYKIKVKTKQSNKYITLHQYFVNKKLSIFENLLSQTIKLINVECKTLFPRLTKDLRDSCIFSQAVCSGMDLSR